MTKKQSKPKVRMLLDRILVKPNIEPDKTPGGIIVPDSLKSKLMEGEVILVGPGATVVKTGKHIPMDLKPGERILFSEHARNGAVEYKEGGVLYLVMTEKDVQCVLVGGK